MAKVTKNLEELFEELDEIVKLLEEEEISLEDSFQMYNKGMKILKSCNDSIDKVEKKLIVIDAEEYSNSTKDL